MYAGGDERAPLGGRGSACSVQVRFGGAAVGRRNRRRVKQHTPLHGCCYQNFDQQMWSSTSLNVEPYVEPLRSRRSGVVADRPPGDEAI